MKKLNKKKGFTIVELVIVIAVVGVLTAVLVPTFVNLTNQARKAENQTFVKNLNTQMAIREATEGKNKTMYEAMMEAEDIGYNVEKLSPVDGNDVVWDSVANRFAIVDKDGKEVYSDGGIKATKKTDLWKIYAEMPAPETQTYSIYAKEGWKVSVSDLKVGFDAGKNTGIATVSYIGTPSVSSIRESIEGRTPKMEMVPSQGQEVVIRTNGGSLTINAANDKVTHYGIANKVDIQAVAPTSYVENGIVSIAKIKTGRIVVTPEAVLTSIHVVETNGNYNNIKVAVVGSAELPGFTRDEVTMNDGDKKLVIEVQSIATLAAIDESPEYIWISKTAGTTSTDVATSATTLDDTTKVPVASQSTTAKAVATDAVEGTTAEQLAEMEAVATRYAGGQGIESNPYLLATKAHFGSIDEDYHNGVTAGKYYKLVADLDLGKIYPIGSMSLSGNNGTASQGYTITYSSCFEGNLDGGNHSITYSLVADSGLASSSNSIGLFGAIENSTIKNLTINAEITSDKASTWVGGLAGFGWRCTLENVTINGNIVGAHDVGGFFGYYSNESVTGHNANAQDITFKNCVNNANVICNSKRTTSYAVCGGFIGQFTPGGTDDFTINFVNCQSNGSISIGNTASSNNAAASYFVGFASDNVAATGKNIRLVFNNCSVGNDASFTSSLGDTRTNSNHTIYCGSSTSAIVACPAIKYVGVTSNLWVVNPSNGAKDKVIVNNVEQDMSLYFVE